MNARFGVARLVAGLGAVGMLFATPGAARGHAVDDGSAVLRVDGEEVRLSITPPAEAFPRADANRDGRIDGSELRAARDGVLATFHESVRLRSERQGEVSEPSVEFEDVLVPHAHDGRSESSSLWFVAHYRFAGSALPLRLEYELGGGPIDVTVGDVTGVVHEGRGGPVVPTVVGHGRVSAAEPVAVFAPERSDQEDEREAGAARPWLWAAGAVLALVLLALHRATRRHSETHP